VFVYANLTVASPLTQLVFPVEFNLKRVLKSLLLSTSDPISIKDIQKVVQRHHDERRVALPDAESGSATTDALVGQE
ncbi:MAG TPA: hypothetical protein DCY41_01665, partial [Opitutae bacterium]|nr:hypothetical protein [Opitutae bacterium]